VRRIALLALSIATGAGTILTAASGSSPSLGSLPIGSAAHSAAPHSAVAAHCPPGERSQRSDGLQALAAGTALACAGSAAPERTREMLAANAQLEVRHQGQLPVSGEAYASAVAQGQRLAAQPPFDGAGWRALGTGPLNADNAAYPSINGEGFHNLSGRIQSFDHDPADASHWVAAVANGGVFETRDAGASWHSIGQSLPTQIVGAVAFDGSRLLAGSGDPAFGGSSFAGLGAFFSDDGGRTWQRAAGIPNGTITFRIAVDPANQAVVYQATGKGLWRSVDQGRTYQNVGLPTTCTNINDPLCFFANIVTDVVVKAGGGKGSSAADKGSEVLAAVGWRAGEKPNQAGKPQAPRDGLYTSRTGQFGTFSYLTPSAFGGAMHFGRTALGLAYGPAQDHNYVYALVEDPVRFNGQAGTAGLPPLPLDPTGLGNVVLNPTVLNGVYGSSDFGKTWALLEGADELCNPATAHSALAGTECVLGYAPGVQSWYNEWIQPDPSSAAADGTPQFLSFGLEEVWGGSASLAPLGAGGAPGLGGLPKVGTGSQFSVFGRYFSGTTCLALNLPTQGLCPTTADPARGTLVQGGTTHPDQHAAMYVPGTSAGRSTLVVGNDGGAYKQGGNGTASYPYDNDHWGNGINRGLDTLLPYDAEMARDGTVWGGLQDNGELKIEKNGIQNETFGGDGFFSAVEPNNSDVAYEEYTGGAVSVTVDGGQNWRSINPSLTSPLFSTPFVMDPASANHLVIGGREVKETTKGSNTDNTNDPTASSDWLTVFDLGTHQHPGDATAIKSKADPNNSLSAVDVRGNNSYVGFCGYCDIVTGGLPFGSGIATNVSGAKPAKTGTSDGWHIAKGAGLPQRIVNSVTIDPSDPKTVYVTLGGYGRRWIPPGSLGDNTSKIGSGHVFVSRDAGASFTDISGDLPDVAADSAVLHDGDLVVGTDLGVFGVRDASRLGRVGRGAPQGALHYAAVGTGLPKVPVFTLRISPRNHNEVVAATMGRGVQDIVLSPGSNPRLPSSGLVAAPAGAATPGATGSGGGSAASGPAPQGGAASAAAPAPGSAATTNSADAGSRASLAATGLQAAVPLTALILLAGGSLLGRRRARRFPES